MFQRVIVVIPGSIEARDSLVLGSQIARPGGSLLVAHVVDSEPAPLTGGPLAAAHRRAQLRDAGEEVYATLGPDERVRYVTLSGAPLAEAVRDLARREQAEAIVIGQNALAPDGSVSRLLSSASCVVLVAPVGHRFHGTSAHTRHNGVSQAR